MGRFREGEHPRDRPSGRFSEKPVPPVDPAISEGLLQQA